MDDPDTIASMRHMVKSLLEYDSTEGFQKQREFLQGLASLINQDEQVFMKNGGLQLLLPFLDSKDVKVQAAVAGVIGKLAARSDEFSCMFIHEGAVDALAILCLSQVKQVVTSALACLATLCKTDDNAIAIAQHEHIFEALVHVLANVDDRQLNRLAAVTIGNFGSHVAVRPFMRDSGVMQALVECLDTFKDDRDMLVQVARGFAAMAMESECQVDLIQSRSADKVLSLYEHEDQEIREFAAMALLNIALNAENKAAILMNDSYLSAINHIGQNGTAHLKQMAVGVSTRLKEEGESKTVADEEVE